jgi:hypothetical protein
MSNEQNAAPTPAEIAEAFRLMEDAKVAADLARDAFSEAEARYNDLVSVRPQNDHLSNAVADYFARQDEIAAKRHEAVASAAAMEVVSPVNAPSVLDASRQLSAKMKKRGPVVPAN